MNAGMKACRQRKIKDASKKSQRRSCRQAGRQVEEKREDMASAFGIPEKKSKKEGMESRRHSGITVCRQRKKR